MSLKIIIVYASSGAGHRRAAEAVYCCLKENHPELNITFVDILEYTNLWFARCYSRGYSFLVTHLRFVWAIGYYVSSFKYVCCFLHFISRLNCGQFINLLVKEQVDIVLATHFFPLEVVANLKRRDWITSRLVTVITDFSVHPLWINDNCDGYIVGLEDTRRHLISRGINQDRIRVMGIPIDSGFSIRCPRESSSPYAFDWRQVKVGMTALLVTGSFGFSFIEKAVDMLFSEINLLVVCGNNQRLYDRLVHKRYSKVQLFGFTKDMPELMSQADIIITKPGGLTIAESLAMELPLIFISSIPGQETKNARILEGYGCGINVRNLRALKGVIINLKSHPERLGLMRANIQKFKKPDAAERICQYVCSGSF